ncbi:MAG TPA: hypothetical protein VFA11_10315 [Acidimicrobiales bacterium]|nr:hypothetical protein [Acidimicrobiales bacterium]
MVTSWLLKIVLVTVLFFFVAIEGLSPIIVKMQLSGYAQDAADAGTQALINGDASSAKAAAQQSADMHAGVTSSVTVSDDSRTVTVTMEKKAKSYFSDWSALRSWYDVKVTETANRGQ